MNFQGNNPDSFNQQQFSSGGTRQAQRSSQLKISRNVKPQNSSSPTAIQRKNMMYQAQNQQMQQPSAQQFNLPAVNQSNMSEQNSSGYAGMININQTQRLNMGALTSRGNDHPTLSQVQLLQNQQMMIPSNYSNNQMNMNTQIKQSQNEKIKSYSRKLAKLVSSGVSGGGGGSASNSRTPNAKKKLKPTSLGMANPMTQSINNPSIMMKTVRSGQNTSRGHQGITPTMLATSAIYNNASQGLSSARSNNQIQPVNKGQSNTTFDLDEHIKNVIKSVERRTKQNPYNQSVNSGAGISSSYLQTNLSQLLGGTQVVSTGQNVGGNGSKTARNQIVTQLQVYSPDNHTQSLSKSPTNRNMNFQNPAIFTQAAQNSNKSTIFSNFSNNTYYIGQKKNSQQSHSLGKKGSYQGAVLNSQSTILVPKNQNPNVSGSLSRKRGSTKRDNIAVLAQQQPNQSRNQESEIFSATQRSIRGYDDAISIRKKRASIGSINQNQAIPSHAAIQYSKKSNVGGGSKTSRVNTSQYNRQVNQSQQIGTSNSAAKKQQNWFSPPSSSHINNKINMSSSTNAFVQQNVLSTIDNNSSTAMIDKTQRTSQFVSPRSFLNKSGGNQAQMLSSQILNTGSQNQRHSIGDRNPLLIASYDLDENYNNHMSQLDWQKLQRLSQMRIFQNFTTIRFFRLWKNQCQKSLYNQKRLMLSENLIQAKSQTFGEYHRMIMAQLNQIKHLSFVESSVSDNVKLAADLKGKDSKAQSKVNVFNDSVQTIRVSLEKLQTYIIKSNQEFERRIKESGSTGRKSQNQGQDKKGDPRTLDKNNLKVIQQRQSNFDRFLQLSLVALSSSITTMLSKNKSFTGQKIRLSVKFQINGQTNQIGQDPKLQMYATHSEYYLITQPSFKSLNETVKLSIQESDQLVYNNRKLIEALNKIVGLFLLKQSGTLGKWDISSFYQKIDNMMKLTESNLSKDQILELISRDIEEAEGVIRRMDDLKQIIQFEERWQGSLQNNQTGDAFITDIESNRETWNLMERFQELIQQIPTQPLTLRYLTLDFRTLYDQLQKIPKRVIQHIERKVASSLETDTIALKQDLSKAYEILEQSPSSLNVYVEQVNTLKFIKETMGELSNRHDTIKKLSLLCKTDNRINIKDSVQITVQELETYIENLPMLVRHCTEKLELSKPQMEAQMRQSCQSLTNKITAFQKKYVDHYIDDPSKLNETSQTLNELKYRQKMIDEIKSKVELYQECINIMNMKDQFQKATEITCFEDYSQLEQLHKYTLKLWTILDEWRSQRTALLQKPFLKLNFLDITNLLEDSMSFFEQKMTEDQLFRQRLTNLSQTIQKEMSELQLIIYLVKDLKKECIKKKHWNMIFNELGIQNLIGKEDFTLQELQSKGKIYSYEGEIREIVRIAEQEQDYDDQYLIIRGQMEDKLRFKFVEYKNPNQPAEEKIYLISEFDIVQSQLEEFMVVLKKGQKSPLLLDIDMKDNFIEQFTIIENMVGVIEKINDAQKMILTLDAIFSQTKIQNTLVADHKKFLEIKKLFKNSVTGKIYVNPTLKNFQSLCSSIQETLDKITSAGTLIQKSLEDYLEAKRLAFPRFFFMTDKQFLEFIELAEQNLDFNRFINILFPGVSKVFLDQPLQQVTNQEGPFRVPPPMVNDLSQIKSEMIDISSNLQASHQQYQMKGNKMMNQKEAMNNKGLKTGIIELDNLDKLDSQYNSKRSKPNEYNKPQQVMGLISSLNELFLFERKVPYQQNKVECWLQGAESNMQDTVGKLINYAVNTFPKQSLDEWILDYPQQVILTTIHLILTHEINELFEEMRKEKENGDGMNRQSSDHGGDDSEDDYTGATPKTPDTRDLIKNSQISHRNISQHISQKSSIRFMRKKDEVGGGMGGNNNGVAPRKVSTHEFNNKGNHNGNNQTSSNYSSTHNHQKIKNQQQFRQNQVYTEEGMLGQHELGGYPNMDDEEDFTESELEALDISRERKKFASNMFGSDFDLNLVADNKDETMRILQEKSFRGLYLRLQFWINQICKSLYMSKPCNQDWKSSFEKDLNNLNAPDTPNLQLDLHPVQRLVMQTIINFLSYMRDVVYELKSKKIDNVEDFEWQKQMRLTWNGKDSGCKVDCGAWTTQQANEYFGAKQRVPLTPLTNKYFVFISAAFREKSAVLFRCIPSHDYCGDIFQEFSSICSVPFKEYQCNPKLSMKSLMQFLNGAALASVWIFFEHVDKLDYVHLQTFNKEIQMVQQQFIIAELSQDSSVITAHITVGNQSISQCQRSIERIREQASLESKQNTNGHNSTKNANVIKMTNIVGGGNDIKIEDNVDAYNYDDNNSPSNFDDEDEDNSIHHNNNQNYDNKINIIQQDKLARQSSRKELQYQKQGQDNQRQSAQHNYQSNQVLQNLSQLDLDYDEFNQDHNQLEEDQCDEIKLDDNQNNTLGGGQSKLNNQNKVCFGVFASISHCFNLKKEKWATEVSTALQSAFRVLSLTRPEMPIITTMLLKSEGFREYRSLSVKLNDAIMRVADFLQLNDRDDSFSLSVRDLKRLSKCASCLLEEQIISKSEQQNLFAKSKQKKNKLMTYPQERRSKQTILREIEEEDEREKQQKVIRQHMEEIIICHVLGLFLQEKLQAFYASLKVNEEKSKKEIRSIISSIFGKNALKEADQLYSAQGQDASKLTQKDAVILQTIKNRGLNIPNDEISKVKLFRKTIFQKKPVCIVGKNFSGKSEYTKLIVKDLLKLNPVYFSPTVIGTHREIYGIYDPFSTTQQVIEQQVGALKHSLFSVLKNEIQKPNQVLVVDGEFDTMFNETLIPYLEYQTFKEQQTSETHNGESITLVLPNGIQETLRKDIPIIYEMRDLERVSPRFVNAVQIINTREIVDLKEYASKMKSVITKKILNKFKSNQKQVEENVAYSVDEILLPALNELRKAKYLEKIRLKIAQGVQYCIRTYSAIINELKSIGNIEQTLIKASLMTILMAIGNILGIDGKNALEEVFSGMKSQLGIRGSIFNYCLDYDTLDIIELRQNSIENDIILNSQLLRASNYARLMLKNGKDFQISGQHGSQKSTTIRYIMKSYQNDIASKVIKVPITCFISQKSVRSILNTRSSLSVSGQQIIDDKPTLLILEDINVLEHSFNFDLIEYLRLVKQNQFGIFHTDHPTLVRQTQKFISLITSSPIEKYDNQKSQANIFNCDTQSQEFDIFVKQFISRKLQVQASLQTQLSNIIYRTYQFLGSNKNLSVSSILGLNNMHLITSLIQRINSNNIKEQSVVDVFLLEVKRNITDRIIFPSMKTQVYENIIKSIKEELPSNSTTYHPLTIDNLTLMQNGQKTICEINELRDFFGSFTKPMIKVLANLYSNIKRPNQHFAFISCPGSRLSDAALNIINEKLKFSIWQPDVSKFRDSHTFVDQINNVLFNSLKGQKRQIILLEDNYLNDLSYIDYIVNLVASIKEGTQNSSLSYFNSLDIVLERNLRQTLIECARELYNQQISHSPHSGISSPASPSSLTASITDSQLLMNALTKISQNVHVIISIQNLQNYQTYTSSYPQLEHLFQVAYVPEEHQSLESVYSDIQQWIHDYSLDQVYQSTFISLQKKHQFTFNNEYNGFYIPEQKLNILYKDPLFDDINNLKVNSELNLTIPSDFTQCSYRFETFKQLHQTIKDTLYKSLASQKQFYQQYYEQYEQLQADYMKKILTKDQSSVTKNHVLIFNLISIQEKIEMIQAQIKHKEQSIKQKEKEKIEQGNQLEKLKDDLQINKTQAEANVIQYVLRLKQLNNQEFKNLSQALVSGQLSDSDTEIIQALQAVLSSKKSVNNYLQSPNDLISRLKTVTSQGIQDVIVTKFTKQVTKKFLQNEQDKSLIGVITKIINELFKKSSLDKKYQQYDNRIKQLKDLISYNQTIAQLYHTQLTDIKEELEDLLGKEKNLSQIIKQNQDSQFQGSSSQKMMNNRTDIRDILKRYDMKEMKNLRNDYKLKSLLKQGKKSEAKLDKVKIRMKNLEGDSLILACSVVYLGALSIGERMEIRKQLAEKLLQQRNVESSEYWQNTQSEQVHSKYFKKIIQNDLGLKSHIFNKISHLFVDSLFSEFLFTYIYCPTTPIIYDSVGNYQQEFTEQVLDEMNRFKVKVKFSSDYMIQEKIINTLEINDTKQGQLIFLNDLCDYSKHIQGKSQDQPILHRLSQPQYFKKIPLMIKENPSLCLPAITLFSANQCFNLNHDYLAKATIFNATYVNKNEAWIEIKQILLKHFLPDNYQKLTLIKQQTQMLRLKLLERQKAFDQLFMKIKRQNVEEKDHKQLEDIRLCFIDIKQLEEDYQQYNQAFHSLINEHPLLASYSNIFVILYYALKELSKFTEEITYSWKIYTKVIDMIIAKIIRDLTMNLKNKENEDSFEGEDGQDGQNSENDIQRQERKKKKQKDKEFTIDEEFFHSVIMPSIYSTIVAGIKQEHVSLFNLIFSLEIALKKTTVNQEDKDFFVEKFFKIKNCYDWRLNPHKPSTIPSGFAEPHQRIKQLEYMGIKRDVLKIYPDLRKLFETIEIKIGKEFTYKEANSLLYQKLFKTNNEGQQWKDIPLIKKLNVGFICPDDEWRSKICQFVYEELTTIFDFTEDLNKLHNFIKTASWSLPVALFTSNSINIVNTVCSIASYYGVGLEVLRTDYQQSIKKHERYYQNKEVNDNLKSSQVEADPEKPLSNEAACIHYDQIDPTKEDRVMMQKSNYQRMFSKDELEIDDKQITQNQSSIQLIEKCAENGTWVLISTLKFPSFWYKISRKLEKMSKKGKVLNTFRLFFDLQGYSLQEIPESFLFNHSVKFYLTEKNNEDMEGFNDVWANILNDDLLNAKDLHNVPVLEPPSDLVKINLNLESNIIESSMESLVPHIQTGTSKDYMNPNGGKKTVKDDKITYSMSQYQSKDTIILPQIFTQEHMRDIMTGGNDLKSPSNKNKIPNKLHRQGLEDEISEISIGNRFISSGLMSGGQSLLMEDMSRVEGAFLSELNQAFARKMSSVNKDEEEKNQQNYQNQQNQQQQRYEMVKKPAPNHKRQQPPQKH